MVSVLNKVMQVGHRGCGGNSGPRFSLRLIAGFVPALLRAEMISQEDIDRGSLDDAVLFKHPLRDPQRG